MRRRAITVLGYLSLYACAAIVTVAVYYSIPGGS
nr:MAG TPA: hypothetical protein [Caudoviricetes sp.]